MSFLPAVMPYLGAASPYLAAAGGVAQASSAYSAAKFNQSAMANEQNLSVDTANAQEGLVRRNSREMLGRQVAAFGAAGVGYGGSSARALEQSAVNQEYDALQTRYKGALAGYGYGVQSQQDGQEAKAAAVNGGLLAGSALLKGLGNTYSGVPPTGPFSTPTPGYS